MAGSSKPPKWNHRCERCGWEWESLLAHPRVCPRCKSYVWTQSKEKK